MLKKKLKPRVAARRNVFISFADEDKPLVDLLRGQALNHDSSLEFNDWSLRAPFASVRAKFVRSGIRERILQASVTLVYVSDQTAKSKWVNWEVEESITLGKKVIGVYQGEIPKKLPLAIKQHGIKLIEWNHAGIAKALR